MQIDFEVDGIPAQFFRDSFTGRAEVRTGGGILTLDDPFDPATHFSLGLTKQWKFSIGNVNVLVEKKRPLLLAGFRPSLYRVYVRDVLVAEQTGL